MSSIDSNVVDMAILKEPDSDKEQDYVSSKHSNSKAAMPQTPFAEEVRSGGNPDQINQMATETMDKLSEIDGNVLISEEEKKT